MDDILKLVCSFLNKEGIDYVIVGGLAVIFHGTPRTTMDADMILKIEEERMPKLIEFFEENGFFASLEDMKVAFKEKSHCTVEDKKSMIRLDIKGMYNEMDQRTFKRRIDFVHKGTKIYLASPEDTIANKLLFGSEQDVKDAEGIYARQLENLDIDHLIVLCKDLDVHDEFLAMKSRVEKYL